MKRNPAHFIILYTLLKIFRGTVNGIGLKPHFVGTKTFPLCPSLRKHMSKTSTKSVSTAGLLATL